MLLIGIPVCLFWKVQLPDNQRKLLRTVFTAAILTTVASIVHVVYIFKHALVLIIATGHILVSLLISVACVLTTQADQCQAAVSLLVCNLLVVVPLCYRLFRKDELGKELEASTLGISVTTTARGSETTGFPPLSNPLTDVSTMHSGLFSSLSVDTERYGSDGHKVPSVVNHGFNIRDTDENAAEQGTGLP